jgi:hypothetical protein
VKKIISAVAVAILAACGGGGDDTPKYNYAQFNGVYNCALVNTSNVFQVQAKFTENAAVLDMLGKTFTYDDLFSWFKDRPRYSERLAGTNDYETVAVVDGGLIVYQGPGSDINSYYEGRLIACVKVQNAS